jgi:DNA-binding NtrC family response regulator
MMLRDPMADAPVRGATEAHSQEGVMKRPPQPGVPRFTAVSGPGAGRSFVMTNALATVGRHATNDLVLTDPRVSAVHLHLRRHTERVHVRDPGSTNGTWLGPHRISEVELAAGAEVIVGDTRLRLDLDDGAEPAIVSPEESFGQLVGESTPMRELFATLARVAPKNIGLLLHGETGTGKEEIARAIHARSPRAAEPFVVIDATSLPETLAESLLFGHEKGAFTGATDKRIGLFEAAHRGTVLLDEIGELPPSLQAKFLRVLERYEFQRVGGSAPVKVDVRVIAATHRDLRNEIDAGRFREDLYFRLAQLRIQIPPLRDRLEDIPILCRKLLESIAGDREIFIEQAAVQHLAAQPWPGNVRELRNVLARAAALCTDGIIRRVDVAGEGGGFRGTREERNVLDLSGTFVPAKERAVQRFEAAYLAALMKRCGGNLSKASREADLARHHLRDLLKKRGLYGASWTEGSGENE